MGIYNLKARNKRDSLLVTSVDFLSGKTEYNIWVGGVWFGN